VQVALRQHRPEDGEEYPAQLDVGALHLDLVHREATFDGRPLHLTPRELDFLAFLARNAGKICTRRMILENVWGPGYASELHYLKVYAYRIRRKLGDEQGDFLQSDPSVGYRLAWPSGPAARPPGDKPRAGADPAGPGKDIPRVGAGSAHAPAQTVPPSE